MANRREKRNENKEDRKIIRGYAIYGRGSADFHPFTSTVSIVALRYPKLTTRRCFLFCVLFPSDPPGHCYNNDDTFPRSCLSRSNTSFFLSTPMKEVVGCKTRSVRPLLSRIPPLDTQGDRRQLSVVKRTSIGFSSSLSSPRHQ
jgi:hypothetical protein